jgi:hypothetical protein
LSFVEKETTNLDDKLDTQAKGEDGDKKFSSGLT